MTGDTRRNRNKLIGYFNITILIKKTSRQKMNEDTRAEQHN
jgi:hypothetical protein